MEKDYKHIIFFTGAGISVDSGIPTFAEQPGIRDKLTRTYANRHPEKYRAVIRSMVDVCENAEPNAAHLAIAELGCPVITMNVDGLHTKAGSKNVVEVHGVLPTREQLEDEYFPQEYRGIVLYGDTAPKYVDAYNMVNGLGGLGHEHSLLVIVGTSFYTGISANMLSTAEWNSVDTIVINDNASVKVPELCRQLKNGCLDIHAWNRRW